MGCLLIGSGWFVPDRDFRVETMNNLPPLIEGTVALRLRRRWWQGCWRRWRKSACWWSFYKDGVLDGECLLCTLWRGRLWREALCSLSSSLLLLEQQRSLEDLAGASSWWRRTVFFGGLPLLESPGILLSLVCKELLLSLIQPPLCWDSRLSKT